MLMGNLSESESSEFEIELSNSLPSTQRTGPSKIHPQGKTLLFLDGGGVKGLVTIKILMKIESLTGRKVQIRI